MTKRSLQKPARECVSEVHTLLSLDDTIEEGLAKLRAGKVIDKIIYFYVVDREGRLVGVVPTRKLLLSDPKTAISKVMIPSTIQITEEKTLEEALELFEKHRLLALPVVNHQGKLLGAIDVEMYMDESFDLASARHQREVFQILGMTLEEGKKTSLVRDYRLRMPWLFCNMISGLICAVISRVNERVMGKFLLLAFFIPLVLTLSESVSMQSMTQSLQLLRRPRFTWKTALQKGLWEWKLVVLIGLSSGLIIGILSLLWKDGLLTSLVIGIGIAVSVALSAIFGISVPIFLNRTRLDPKIASGPVVLMIADVLTTLFYLSLATWWLL